MDKDYIFLVMRRGLLGFIIVNVFNNLDYSSVGMKIVIIILDIFLYSDKYFSD